MGASWSSRKKREGGCPPPYGGEEVDLHDEYVKLIKDRFEPVGPDEAIHPSDAADALDCLRHLGVVHGNN